MKTTNIMIVGVGGQGTLLASRVLGHLLLEAGYDVKMSEVHGMSQRGGSVVTYVRFGEKVYSPIVCQGEADFILSFEKLEAARYLSCLAPNGLILTNSQEISPMPVITGAAEYPHEILDDIQKLGAGIDAFDALDLAQKAGSSKCVNIVLLGRLSTYFDLDENAWLDALRSVVAPKFLDMNIKAFQLGRSSRL
ncbi:MAG: indolepyruvate oxidoreductase subunit beta [Clostridia bacterium]|nr:indolepyruvate oxidoreductase subunit beta [Clostridia bacterium]